MNHIAFMVIFSQLSFYPSPAVDGTEHNFLTPFVAGNPISSPTIKLQRMDDDIMGVERVISHSGST